MLKNYSKIEIDKSGTKLYLNDEGERHRLDGPAVEDSNGTKFWRINGNSHRNIDPSEEWSNGGKYWLFKGRQHRIGGSCNSVYKAWYIHGKGYTEQQYYKKVWCI